MSTPGQVVLHLHLSETLIALILVFLKLVEGQVLVLGQMQMLEEVVEEREEVKVATMELTNLVEPLLERATEVMEETE
jgi:cobalamin-dependent methionine synthase I